MNHEKEIIAVIAVFAIIIGTIGYRLRPRHLKVGDYQEKWMELQKLCSNKDTWPDALISADKLLDRALKKRHFSGKSPGERLVSAQRVFTDNDTLWFAHKLRNKVDSEPKIKLRERDVKDALLGIRQGLKDIGALPSGKSKDTE